MLFLTPPSEKWVLTNLLQSLKAVFGLILHKSVTLSDLELPILLHHLFYPPQTPARALISAHFKPSQPFSLPPASWAVPHINSMKCRVGPLQVATKPSPPQPGSDTTTKIHNIFTHLPQAAVMQAELSSGAPGRGEMKRINQAIKTNCFVTHLVPPQSCRSSVPHMQAEQESGTPGHQSGNSFVKSLPQLLLLGHKLRSRGWIRGMCLKPAL